MPYALLIVDDNPDVLRALQRLLRRYFDDLRIAETAEQAQAILENESITHLICDNDLGCAAHGVDLIPLWRRQFPDLQRVILYTGCDVSELKIPVEIDAVVLKSDEPSEFRDALFTKEEIASGVRGVLGAPCDESSRDGRRVGSG